MLASHCLTWLNRSVRVRFQKRAHNPLLLASGYASLDPALPWLGGKRLRLLFRTGLTLGLTYTVGIQASQTATEPHRLLRATLPCYFHAFRTPPPSALLGLGAGQGP